MYKADITNTSIKLGRLIVEVKFYNDSESFSEIFETSQGQKDTWIGEQIKQRLKHLNSLASLKDSIQLGVFTDIQKEKTESELYYEKAALYLKYMDVARMGLIQSDRPIIGELRTWLRENFKDEFIPQIF